MALYKYTLADYECSQDYFFSGPEMMQTEWADLCDSVMEEAGAALLLKSKSEDEPTHIWLTDVLDEMESIFLQRGFQKLEFITAEYVGLDIRHCEDSVKRGLGESYEALRQHNENMDSAWKKQIEFYKKDVEEVNDDN